MCIFDKLDDLVNKHNNTYHRTIKIKPADVKPSKYIEWLPRKLNDWLTEYWKNIEWLPSKENDYQDPKFKVGDIVGISKYKNIFAKGYVPNWSEEFFVNKKS